MHRCVWSRKLKNEEAMDRVGPQRHGGGGIVWEYHDQVTDGRILIDCLQLAGCCCCCWKSAPDPSTYSCLTVRSHRSITQCKLIRNCKSTQPFPCVELQWRWTAISRHELEFSGRRCIYKYKCPKQCTESLLLHQSNVNSLYLELILKNNVEEGAHRLSRCRMVQIRNTRAYPHWHTHTHTHTADQ